MSEDLMWTFFSCQVQPFRRQEMFMWMYPRPSYPDRPFSAELDDMKINTRVHRVLDRGADLILGSSPIPLSP
jgi:hypothetical protein